MTWFRVPVGAGIMLSQDLDQLWLSPCFQYDEELKSFRGWLASDRSVKMTTHLHLLSMLRVRGALPSRPLYTFMAGTILPFINYLEEFLLKRFN
jgi:hypothetical protein